MWLCDHKAISKHKFYVSPSHSSFRACYAFIFISVRHVLQSREIICLGGSYLYVIHIISFAFWGSLYYTRLHVCRGVVPCADEIDTAAENIFITWKTIYGNYVFNKLCWQRLKMKKKCDLALATEGQCFSSNLHWN